MPSDETAQRLIAQYEKGAALNSIAIHSRNLTIAGIDKLIDQHKKELRKWEEAEKAGDKKVAPKMIKHHKSKIRKEEKERKVAVKRRDEVLKKQDEFKRRIAVLKS